MTQNLAGVNFDAVSVQQLSGSSVGLPYHCLGGSLMTGGGQRLIIPGGM